MYDRLLRRVSLLFARNRLQGAGRALPRYCFCVAQSNLELLFCPRYPVLFGIVLEIKTGVLAGSFLEATRNVWNVWNVLSVWRTPCLCCSRTQMLDRTRDLGRPERSRRQFPPVIFCPRQTRRKLPGSLEVRISYRRLLVEVSEGDRPPKDTSEEEIEDSTRSGMLGCDNSECWSRLWGIRSNVEADTGSLARESWATVSWCLSRKSYSPEFWYDNKMHVQCVTNGSKFRYQSLRQIQR